MRVREKGDYVVRQLTQTLEVSSAALGMGVLSGRYGALRIPGTPVPLDLVIGVALHGLGLAGAVSKQYTDHLHNFGDGVLAAYATKLGAGFGVSWRNKTQPGTVQFPVAGETARMHGGMPASHSGRERLTEAELAAMASAAR
jgi:hypothetical protein